MSIEMEKAVNDALADGVTIKIKRNILTCTPSDLPSARRVLRYRHSIEAATRADGPLRCYACPSRNVCRAQAIARGDIGCTCILESKEADHANV